MRLSSNEDNRKKDSWNKLLTNSCLSIFFSRVVMLLSSVSFMMVSSACKEYMTLILLLFTFSRGYVNILNRTRKQLLVRLIGIWTIEKGGILGTTKFGIHNISRIADMYLKNLTNILQHV